MRSGKLESISYMSRRQGSVTRTRRGGRKPPAGPVRRSHQQQPLRPLLLVSRHRVLRWVSTAHPKRIRAVRSQCSLEHPLQRYRRGGVQPTGCLRMLRDLDAPYTGLRRGKGRPWSTPTGQPLTHIVTAGSPEEW